MLPIKSKSAFEALTQGAQILEEDGSGIKVMRLPDDRIVKLFRRKRILSSQIWSPLATRFKRNSEQLTQRGILTIRVNETFELPHIQRQGVLYQALPGETLRDWINQNDVKAVLQKIKAYGVFVAQIHERGALFRSMHLGNVLVTENGELALIDIADITFRRLGGLSTSQRKRNFKHITRYTIDRALLVKAGINAFSDAYFAAAGLSKKTQLSLTKTLKQQLSLAK